MAAPSLCGNTLSGQVRREFVRRQNLFASTKMLDRLKWPSGLTVRVPQSPPVGVAWSLSHRLRPCGSIASFWGLVGVRHGF